MNWNGQRNYLDHLIARRLDPDRGSSLQSEFNARRMARVQSALNTRPVFLPLEFSMTAAGQVSPYRDTTESLSYDVIITGIKTDADIKRDIIIRRTEEEKPITYVGEELNLFLRVDDVAGVGATSGGGQLGVFYLPSPIPLPAGNRLVFEMFKTDATAATEEVNIVLVGIRVFRREYGEVLLDRAERDSIDFHIRAREIPQVRFLKQTVSFDSAVLGGQDRNLFTPQVEEPLLIRGVRTTLRQSMIEVGIQGEPPWTTKPTPIWGVAGEDELVHDNYQWFSKPIFLHSKTAIEITRLTNGIDGSNIDAQTLNTITWICETV